MVNSCFAYIIFILLPLMTDLFMASGNGLSVVSRQNGYQDREIDQRDPIYSSKFGKISGKILTRHKRIKKSANEILQFQGPSSNRHHFVVGSKVSDIKALQKNPRGVLNNIEDLKENVYRSEKKVRKRPMIVLKEEPYITKNVKTMSAAKKLESNLKTKRLHKKPLVKKFRRSVEYNDLSQLDLGSERRKIQKLQNRYYRARINHRKKMKDGDKFYSLSEAKDELDRRRKLIRKLERRISYKKRGEYAKYVKRPSYSDKIYFTKPTTESMMDRLSNQYRKSLSYGRLAISPNDNSTKGKEKKKAKKVTTAQKTSRK